MHSLLAAPRSRRGGKPIAPSHFQSVVLRPLERADAASEQEKRMFFAVTSESASVPYRPLAFFCFGRETPAARRSVALRNSPAKDVMASQTNNTLQATPTTLMHPVQYTSAINKGDLKEEEFQYEATRADAVQPQIHEDNAQPACARGCFARAREFLRSNRKWISACCSFLVRCVGRAIANELLDSAGADPPSTIVNEQLFVIVSGG